MPQEYPKIDTIFERDDNFVVNPLRLKQPVIGTISEWDATEKIDGTNIRVIMDEKGDVSFNGRTDNAQLPADLVKYLISTFTASKMKEAFNEPGLAVVLYGEGYGSGINGGGGYRGDKAFRLFDVLITAMVYDIKNPCQKHIRSDMQNAIQTESISAGDFVSLATTEIGLLETQTGGNEIKKERLNTEKLTASLSEQKGQHTDKPKPEDRKLLPDKEDVICEKNSASASKIMTLSSESKISYAEYADKNNPPLVEEASPFRSRSITAIGQGELEGCFVAPVIPLSTKQNQSTVGLMQQPCTCKESKWWLDWPNIEDVAGKLGIKTAPYLGRLSLREIVERVQEGMHSHTAIEDSGNADLISEGIVARPIQTLFDKQGKLLRIKLKTKDFGKPKVKDFAVTL